MFEYRLNWGLVTDNLGRLFDGLLILLQVAALAYLIAVVLGVILALLRMSRLVVLRWPATAVIELLRGIPLFLFLFLVYYGAPQVMPLVLAPFTAAVSALALTGAAYAAEIYRGSVGGVPEGQNEAAEAIGLSPLQRFRDVIFPQAARIAIPPAMNLLIALLKGATFISVIGVADMFYVSRDVSLRFFAPFELYTFSGVTIIGVTLLLAGGMALLERRLARAGAV